MNDEVLFRHVIHRLDWEPYFERDTGTNTGFYVPRIPPDIFSDYLNPEYLADPVGFSETYTSSRLVKLAQCFVTITSNRPRIPRTFSQYAEYVPFSDNIPSDDVYELIRTNNERGFTIGALLPRPRTVSVQDLLIEYNGQNISLEYKVYVKRKEYIAKLTNHPSYRSLVGGYELDSRAIPNRPIILSSNTRAITVKYYQQNRLESIPNLKTIAWRVFECSLVENVPFELPIVDCVLGTLYSDDDTLTAIASLETESGKYPFNALLPSSVSNLFLNWKILYEAQPFNPETLPIYSQVIKLRKLAANNDAWNNTNLSSNLDINFDIEHPMFAIDNERAYDWHIRLQSNDSYGNLIMDSPRTIESHAYLIELRKALQTQDYQVENLTSDPPLHYLDWYIKNSSGEKLDKVYKALGAELWGTNPDSPDVARVDNLGWRIRRLSEVLGIRVKTDGTIDEALEKTTNRRLHSSGDTENNVQEYNPNCFGSKGMLVRVLPNKFNPKGTVSGGYSKIIDIPQILAEMHEQANAAMGYQEGTAIEINIDGKVYRYPNQLALLTELLVTAKQTATYSKGAFFSSIVSEQSIKEVMGGLGLRTVDKYLEFNVAGKAAKLYYKGISASQSVRRKLSAVATNVGIAIGNII